MSYSRFTNLGEKVAADLKGKIRNSIGLDSCEFMERKCNCTGSAGACNYDDVGCRKTMVVYRVHCLHPDCNQSYIGQTSQTLKKRMSQHFQEVRKKVKFDDNSDTFARHFGKHLIDEKCDPAPKNQRKYMRFEVLRELDAISAMKGFGRLDCRLCMAERLAILEASYRGEKIMNSRSEIYGGCKHKKRFHNFFLSDDTEEPLNGEKSKS